MPVDDVLLEAEEKMEGAEQFVTSEYRKLRTGRASVGLVDHIKVDYYGSPTALRQLANIGTPEANMIVIRPFDPSIVKSVEKALLQSDVGITPACDGKLIRLAIPPLSEERRRQLAGQVKNMGEQAKISVRNVRRDANREVDKLKSDSAVSEDEAYKAKDDIQELTKESEEKIDGFVKKKSEEIMKF